MLQDLTDEEEILRRAFQFFDKDGNGEISVTELRTTMHELGDLLTEEEIVAFMQVMDVNNDGVIGVSYPIPSTMLTCAVHVTTSACKILTHAFCFAVPRVLGNSQNTNTRLWQHERSASRSVCSTCGTRVRGHTGPQCSQHSTPNMQISRPKQHPTVAQ